MEVTRISMLSGKKHSRELPITAAQMMVWEAGILPLQEAFFNLSAADREFIKTGITAEEWDKTFGSDADLDNDAG